VKFLVKSAVRRYRPWDIARFVGQLPQYIKLYGRLLKDRRVSGVAKTVLLAAFVYLATPLDFLTDLAPVVGQIDDLTLLALACKAFLTLCPRTVVAEHAARIDQTGQWTPLSGG
jgi:uncharacterized membrane protein YkvA (DUF1232 family)